MGTRTKAPVVAKQVPGVTTTQVNGNTMQGNATQTPLSGHNQLQFNIPLLVTSAVLVICCACCCWVCLCRRKPNSSDDSSVKWRSVSTQDLQHYPGLEASAPQPLDYINHMSR